MLTRVVIGLGLLCLAGSGCASAPPFSGWTAEQLFEHGEEALAEEDWSEARRAFERLVLAFPVFERAVDARHHLARAFYANGDYLSAVSEYTRIVQLLPEHERTREAWMGLCRSYAAMSPHPQRDQQYTVQARTTCQNVAGDFQGMPVGDSAAAVAARMHAKLGEKAYAEGHFYFQRDVFESAELVFLELLEGFADTEAAPRAIARLLDIYEEWGWDEQLEDYRERLLARYPDSPEARALGPAPPADTLASQPVGAMPGSPAGTGPGG